MCAIPIVPRPIVAISGVSNSRVLELGSSLELTCSIQPQGVEYVDTTTIIMSNWSAPSIQYSKNNPPNNSIVSVNIPNVGIADDGSYRCIASVFDSSGSEYIVASKGAMDIVIIHISK